MTTLTELRSKVDISPAMMMVELPKDKPDTELMKLLADEKMLILPRKGIYTRVFLGSNRRNITSIVARVYGFPFEETGLIAKDLLTLIESLGSVIRSGIVIDIRYTA